MRILKLLLLLTLVCVEANAQTPAWNGILPTTRAVDWTYAGIPGGIPSGSWTQSGSTIASGASTSTIQTALNACSGSHFVQLASGSFTLSAALHINTSGCELRGSGPTATTVTLNGFNILMGDGSGNQGSTPGGLGSTTLSTLTQGSTVLTVGSTTGLSVGQVVMIYQQNQAWVNPVGGEGNQNATMCPSSPGPLDFFNCSTRSESEMVKITAVGAGTITIAAPGLSQTYTSGLTPQVFYWSTTGPTFNDGIRNIKIDAGASVHSDFAVAFVFCHQCWAQNVAVVNGHRAGIYSLFGYQDEIRDSYVSESNTAGAPTEYGIEFDRGSLFKIENNILFGITSPVVLEASYAGVVGYNYTLNTATDNLFPTLDTHLSHSFMLLFEGNATSNVDWDFVHGSASQNTSFRNFYWGKNPNKTNYRTPYNADAYNRYNNIVANVLGDPTLHTIYVCDSAHPQGSDNFIYGLGFGNGCFGGSSPAYDLTTETSIIRWGNWDAVTYCANGGHAGTACGTTGANGIRYCTASGVGNAACTASETASADPTMPGLSSPATTLPASFYTGVTTAYPSGGTGLLWWKNPVTGYTPPYPPIGPDVTATSNIVANTASHVSKIPAQLCYENGAKTSGFMTAFDAAGCYANDPVNSTFYIRPDGGTRYTAANPTGQCDGKADVAYPGSGVNQHCAFNDVRWMWDDQSYGNYPNWAAIGGDTIILRANTGGVPWRVGFQGNASTTDPWCLGGTGPIGCVMPPIPSGTAGVHTKFLGENSASCQTTRTIMTVNGPRVQQIPDVTKTTKISGGHGEYVVVNLTGSNYVDVGCLDISSFEPACQLQGSPQTNACSRSVPFSDYAQDGMEMSNTSGNLAIQDIYIHGTNSRGIHGQQGVGPVTANRIWISITPQTGWDFDDGSASGTAPWTLTNSIIEASGCQQKNVAPAYPPLSDTQLFSDITYCFDQSSGAVIGDGIGTPPVSGFNVTMDSNVFQWNTQDGEDFGHMDTGSYIFTMTNNVSQHNMGQVFKDGWAFSTVTWLNNVSLADCARMVNGNTLPGAASTVNQYLTAGCRAGDNYSINFQHATQMMMANNTIVGYAPTTFDFKCVDGSNDCSAAKWDINNNIILAYVNPAVNSGIAPADFCGPSCNGPPFSANIGIINRKNNIFFNLRACHANTQTPDSTTGTSTGEACVSPQLVSQPASPMASYSSLDGFNFNLTSSSPAIGGGVSYAGILPKDYALNNQTSPPTIGAFIGTVAAPVFTPGTGLYAVPQAPVGSVTTLGAIIGYTTDGSTPTATTAGIVDHGTTLFTNLQDPAGAGTWTLCNFFTPVSNCAGGAGTTGSSSISFNNSTALGTDTIIQTSNGVSFNTMYFRHLGCPGGSCTAVTGMTEDQDFYIPSTTTHLQALEFDPDLFDGSFEYFASVQCDSASGKWRFWNMAGSTWVPSAFTCSVLTATNTPHHMHLETVFNTTAHTYGISKMVVDGVTVCTSCSSYSALANTGTATVNIEQQIDNDSTAVSNVVYYGPLSLLMAASPLTISTNTTVNAIGTLAGGTNSSVTPFVYTFGSSAVAHSKGGNTRKGGNMRSH